MNSFTERLEEILNKVNQDCEQCALEFGGVSIDSNKTIKEAIEDIVNLIKSDLVPEENKSWGYGSNPEGWNQCRLCILGELER